MLVPNDNEDDAIAVVVNGGGGVGSANNDVSTMAGAKSSASEASHPIPAMTAATGLFGDGDGAAGASVVPDGGVPTAQSPPGGGGGGGGGPSSVQQKF
jgi:hypothetical protein